MERIKSYEKKYPVLIRIEKDSDRPSITIQGRPRGTSGASMKIKDILLEADVWEDKKRDAENLFKQVTSLLLFANIAKFSLKHKYKTLLFRVSTLLQRLKLRFGCKNKLLL